MKKDYGKTMGELRFRGHDINAIYFVDEYENLRKVCEARIKKMEKKDWE
jgi:lysyl-tRNA synthetase class I